LEKATGGICGGRVLSRPECLEEIKGGSAEKKSKPCEGGENAVSDGENRATKWDGRHQIRNMMCKKRIRKKSERQWRTNILGGVGCGHEKERIQIFSGWMGN